MKRTKIIYGDGIVERLVCADTSQALGCAREQANKHGTYVRSQSIVDGNTLIDAAMYQQIGVRMSHSTRKSPLPQPTKAR